MNMKMLFWIGLVLLVLGIASFIVPIPHNDREGITAGDMSIGVNVRHDEKLSPIVSVILILGGAALMVAGAKK
jgi:hypothetical protein